MDRNQFLTEKMGLKYHKVIREFNEFGYLTYECSCGLTYSWHQQCGENINFSTWEGFGKLWEWCLKQEWWDDFVFTNASGYAPHAKYQWYLSQHIIHPDRFADAVAKFLGWKK